MSAAEGHEPYPPEYLAEHFGQRLMDVSIAFIVIITIVYVMFLSSRLLYSERNYWEIWVLYPLSYLLCLMICISCIFLFEIGGAGRHLIYWSKNDSSVIVTFLKIRTVVEFVYMAGVSFPKVAILCLYLRVFINRKVRIITWVLIGVIMTNWVAAGIIANFTICQPFDFKWDKTIPGGHCEDLTAAYKYISIPNIVTDLAISILPLPILYHLEMSRTRKIGVFLTFLAGSLGIITAVIRFVGYYTTDLESDFTYIGVNRFMYTMIEPCAYFICSCLPGTRPLIREMYRKLPLSHLPNSSHSWHGSATKRLADFPLGSYRSGVQKSVSAPNSEHSPDEDENIRRFVTLEEAVRIDYSPPGRVA